MGDFNESTIIIIMHIISSRNIKIDEKYFFFLIKPYT